VRFLSSWRQLDIGYYTFYNTFLVLGTPLWAGYLLQRYVSGKSQPGWRERWGRFPDDLMPRTDFRPRIWVHAVSAGEVVAAVPIVRKMRALLPDFRILFSATTPAGMEMAEKQAAPFVDGLFYFPLDLPWVVKRAVREINPRVFVSLESELWPNLLHELKRRGAHTVMVNGRITERSFRRAVRWGAGLFRWMLSNMDRMLVQTESDATRLRTLGGAAAADRIHVLGNSKFDQDISALSETEVATLRRSLRFPPDAPIFVAGSTRSAAEELIVIDAYLLMRREVADLCLLIAPRQIDRAQQLADAMATAGLEPVRRTEVETATAVRHLVLDTMGELAQVYAVATIAFVGNSFDPVVKGGGQNLLQPLAHGKAVFFGPRTATIRSEVAMSTEAGVGFEVRSAEELAERGLKLIQSASARSDAAVRARALVASQRGASLRYAQAVSELAHGSTVPAL
jgi:3-deoxy-D-manno-octulosonic-acid transferase